MKYLIRDIILYNDKIIINRYFADPLKKHNNSIESVKETEKQSKQDVPLSDFQSSYKGDNSPPSKKEPLTGSFLLGGSGGIAHLSCFSKRGAQVPTTLRTA